jgi:hypothetical protein
MKKMFAFVLCFVLAISLAGTTFTDTEVQVAGLAERLNALWLRNNFTQAQIEEMDRQYLEWFNEGWEGLLKGLKATGKMEYRDDDEKEYQYRLELARLDYDTGLLVSLLNNRRYAKQYAESGSFSYLFADKKFWNVHLQSRATAGARFLEDATFLNGKDHVTILGGPTTIAIPIAAMDFLKDSTRIEQMLLEKGETVVSDIRLFSMDPLTFLYVKCIDNEYIVKLRDGGNGNIYIMDMELFELYSISEAGGKIEEIFIQNIKPTYTTEAESLQAAGLLNGNEKGLDLLKPLTRIEATTLIVRALGLENAQTATESKFVDIPNDNWGVKYANIASDNGITNGVGDGKFAPNDLVTDNQFATLVLRAVDNSDFDWQTGIQLLIEKGVITQENAATMDLFTRGDMAKIIYEAREKGLL